MNLSKVSLLSFLMLSAFFFSCSSSKKLETLKSEKMSLQSKYDDCLTNQTQLKADQVKLKADSDKEKVALQNTLNAKDKEVQGLRNAANESNAKLQKMKKELLAAFEDYPNVKVEERNGRLVVTMPNKILFKSGKVDLDAKGIGAIEVISQVFKNNKGLNILIEGHTDDIPIKNARFKDNWDLSVSRAVVVTRLLEKYGVNPTRMTAAGRGEFVPVSNIGALDEETRAQNRRTEFTITPKIEGLYKMLNQL